MTSPKTKASDVETVLVLDNGCRLVSSSEQHLAGDYVQVLNPEGEEIGYWDYKEWEEDPVLVMGAILRCAATGIKR